MPSTNLHKPPFHLSTFDVEKSLQKQKAKQFGLFFGHARYVSISDSKLMIFDQSDGQMALQLLLNLRGKTFSFLIPLEVWRNDLSDAPGGGISFSPSICVGYLLMLAKEAGHRGDIWKQHKDGWKVYLTASRPCRHVCHVCQPGDLVMLWRPTKCTKFSNNFNLAHVSSSFRASGRQWTDWLQKSQKSKVGRFFSVSRQNCWGNF